jgi:UDP-glucose 4-epimerase
MTTRILVTGGCGFVGAPVVRHLVTRGDRVIVYDDLSRGGIDALDPVRADVRVLEGDVRDSATLQQALVHERIEVIVHLAAMHFIPSCNVDPEQCLSTNVLGTQAALDSVTACPTIRGFVLASTAAVYEPSPAPHRESGRLSPTDVYGNSKLAAEQLVSSFQRRTGMPTGTARLFNVYGPGETNPHLVPTIITQARRGSVLALGDLSTGRDYVFTEDVATAFGAFVEAVSEGRSELCNIGTGRRRTGDEVVGAIAAELGLDVKVERSASRMRSSDRPVLCADITRARERLGWVPTTTFAEGLRAAIDFPARPGVAL